MSRFSRPLNRHNRRKLQRVRGAAVPRGLLLMILGLALVLIIAVARARLQAAI